MSEINLFRLLDKLTGCEDDFVCLVWPYGRKFFYKLRSSVQIVLPICENQFLNPAENVYFIKLPLLAMLFSKLLLKLFKGFLLGFVPKRSKNNFTKVLLYNWELPDLWILPSLTKGGFELRTRVTYGLSWCMPFQRRNLLHAGYSRCTYQLILLWVLLDY